jgi:hypothetical protein
MADLTEFLLARIDEDEAAARAAVAGPWRYNPSRQWHDPIGSSGQRSGEEFVGAGPLDATVCVAATGPADDPQSMADAAHIARWHPAHVLAECSTKRALVAIHGRPHRCPNHLQTDDEPCESLRLLARPYASRPGFAPGWWVLD